MNLLFDLDGTLTDPGLGIARCLQHALSALGRPVPSTRELSWCVGPQLCGTFAKLLGSSDPEMLDRAIGLYRKRFVSVGMFENAEKAELIRHVLSTERFDEQPHMVGDRRHDIEAAHANGLLGVGVLWGYGSRADLEAAGSDTLVESMQQLCEWADRKRRVPE